MVEHSVRAFLSVDPGFTCCLVRRPCDNLLLRVRCSDCGKRVAVFCQLKSSQCLASLFAVGFLFGGFGFVGKGAGFENLGEVFVSFAFGVVGHCLRCSWCCLVETAIHYHLANHFNFPISQWGQKIHCVVCSVSRVTCHWKRLFRRESTPRTNNYTVRWRQNPIYRKSRNE